MCCHTANVAYMILIFNRFDWSVSAFGFIWRWLLNIAARCTKLLFLLSLSYIATRRDENAFRLAHTHTHFMCHVCNFVVMILESNTSAVKPMKHWYSCSWPSAGQDKRQCSGWGGRRMESATFGQNIVRVPCITFTINCNRLQVIFSAFSRSEMRPGPNMKKSK